MKRAILLVFYIHISNIDHYYVRCQNFTLLPASIWQDARIGCKSEGMDLVMIKDNATWTAVSNFISTYYPSLSAFWFGLQWNPETHNFYWLDCEELGPYQNWDVVNIYPEPNCMTNTEITHPVCPTNYDQDCVRMHNSLWKTRGCYNIYQAICEKGNHRLPLTCYEATTNTTYPNQTRTSSSTITSTTNPIPQSTTEQTQISNSSPTPTSAADQKQISTTELPETTEACEFVCPGDPQTTTSRMVNRNTTVLTTEIFKINKKTTGAYIRAHTSAYDGRFSSKVIGLTGAAVICLVVLIMLLFDATRITGTGSRKTSSRRKSGRKKS